MQNDLRDMQGSRPIQDQLEEELARLQKLVPSEETSTVSWRPRNQSTILGQVVGSIIYVYNEASEEALRTLKHEYLDCILTRKLINPLVTLINMFVKVQKEYVYREKEQIVEKLLRLLSD